MKVSDIDRIHEAGLISAEQRGAIIGHFKLDRETNKLLVLLSILGGILISAGIILLVASNWQSIPRLVKLVAGLMLMLGAHYAGARVKQSDRYPVLGEALHLIGSGLFLANIALVGQVYNLSSRPPNAILLWLLGMAPLPWLLRSKAQHILTLCALGLWLGLEMNQPGSLLYFDGEARQFMFYAILGVAFTGLGMQLRRTGFPEFGPATEKFGLLVLHLASYPLTLDLYYTSQAVAPAAWAVAGVVTGLAILLLLLGLRDQSLLPEVRWRLAWAAALVGILGLAWMGLLVRPETQGSYGFRHVEAVGLAVPALFGFCLLQAQVALLRRSPWLLNLAITFIGLHIITAYFRLFGSMRTTGLMFVVSGALLIGLAVFLERKRRALLKRMQFIPAT